jgi:hypothetical protein
LKKIFLNSNLRLTIPALFIIFHLHKWTKIVQHDQETWVSHKIFLDYMCAWRLTISRYNSLLPWLACNLDGLDFARLALRIYHSSSVDQCESISKMVGKCVLNGCQWTYSRCGNVFHNKRSFNGSSFHETSRKVKWIEISGLFNSIWLSFQWSIKHFSSLSTSLSPNNTCASRADSVVSFNSTALWSHCKRWNMKCSVRIVRNIGGQHCCTYKIMWTLKIWWGFWTFVVCETLFTAYNFFSHNFQCLNPSFFLSIDMQLFWLCPLLLYPAYKYGWKYLWVLPTFVAATEVCTFVISLKYELIAFPMLK